MAELWDAGNKEMEHFSKGTEKKRQREAGKGGAGEKIRERKRERECREEGK